MSIHPSLNISAKDKKTRSVLKRAERLKILIDKDEWKEGESIFALPKIKILKMIKIKKEKAAPAAAEATSEAAAAPAEEGKEAKAAPTTAKPTKPSPH